MVGKAATPTGEGAGEHGHSEDSHVATGTGDGILGDVHRLLLLPGVSCYALCGAGSDCLNDLTSYLLTLIDVHVRDVETRQSKSVALPEWLHLGPDCIGDFRQIGTNLRDRHIVAADEVDNCILRVLLDHRAEVVGDLLLVEGRDSADKLGQEARRALDLEAIASAGDQRNIFELRIRDYDLRDPPVDVERSALVDEPDIGSERIPASEWYAEQLADHWQVLGAERVAPRSELTCDLALREEDRLLRFMDDELCAHTEIVVWILPCEQSGTHVLPFDKINEILCHIIPPNMRIIEGSSRTCEDFKQALRRHSC